VSFCLCYLHARLTLTPTPCAPSYLQLLRLRSHPAPATLIDPQEMPARPGPLFCAGQAMAQRRRSRHTYVQEHCIRICRDLVDDLAQNGGPDAKRAGDRAPHCVLEGRLQRQLQTRRGCAMGRASHSFTCAPRIAARIAHTTPLLAASPQPMQGIQAHRSLRARSRSQDPGGANSATWH
jgi:hypothetical protein